MDFNKKILEEFETTIDTIHPENGDVPIRVLGFGEISLVFELADEFEEGIAYKRPGLIPLLIEKVNQFIIQELAYLKIEPLNEKELKDYYKNDKKIWVLFQNFRKLDRWITTKILRRKYDFYLPSKIKR